MLYNSRLPWVCGFLLLWAAPTHAEQADIENIRQQIVSDWQRRQGEVSAVRYVVKGTCTVAKGIFNGDPGSTPGGMSPPADTTHETQRTWLLDLQRGRVRKEIRDFVWVTMEQRFVPMYRELLFDGETVRYFRPAERNPEAGFTDRTPELTVYDKGTRLESLRDVADLPIFFAHGLIYSGDPLEKQLLSHVSADRLRVEGPVDEVPSDGTLLAAVSLRPKNDSLGMVVQYLVDLKRDSAISSCKVSGNGTLLHDMKINHQRTDRGWYPRDWNCTAYNMQGGLFETVQLHVTDVQFNRDCPDSAFSVTPAPGSVVATSSGHYRVGERAGQMTKLGRDAGEAPETLRQGDSKRQVWLPVTAFVILIFSATVLTMRLRRTKASG